MTLAVNVRGCSWSKTKLESLGIRLAAAKSCKEWSLDRDRMIAILSIRADTPMFAYRSMALIKLHECNAL